MDDLSWCCGPELCLSQSGATRLMTRQISVVVAHSSALIRESLGSIIDREPRFRLLGQLAHPDEVVAFLPMKKFDLAALEQAFAGR